MGKSAYVGVYQLLNWKMHGETLKLVSSFCKYLKYEYKQMWKCYIVSHCGGSSSFPELWILGLWQTKWHGDFFLTSPLPSKPYSPVQISNRALCKLPSERQQRPSIPGKYFASNDSLLSDVCCNISSVAIWQQATGSRMKTYSLNNLMFLGPCIMVLTLRRLPT